jgi:hypothetical protein
MSHLEEGFSALLGGFFNFVRVVSLTYFLMDRKGDILGKDFSFCARYEVLMEIQTFWKANAISIGKYLSVF